MARLAHDHTVMSILLFVQDGKHAPPCPCPHYELLMYREKGEELRAAVEEWQDKRNVPQPRLTTGFLDGIQPIVDSYELKVTLPSACIQAHSMHALCLWLFPLVLLFPLFLLWSAGSNGHAYLYVWPAAAGQAVAPEDFFTANHYPPSACVL